MAVESEFRAEAPQLGSESSRPFTANLDSTVSIVIQAREPMIRKEGVGQRPFSSSHLIFQKCLQHGDPSKPRDAPTGRFQGALQPG